MHRPVYKSAAPLARFRATIHRWKGLASLRNLNGGTTVIAPNFSNTAAAEFVPELAEDSWGVRLRRILSVSNVLAAIALTSVAVLIWCSLYLAAMRIYQVDEACNVYCAHTVANREAAGGQDLYQIFLSWLLPAAGSAVELFSAARLIMVVVFWLNWILIASATGARIFSRRWLFALLGAATLAPLWDYGFEARHDNVLLAGILLIWGVVRFQPPKLTAYFFVGAGVVALEFIAMKAFVYTIPISLGILLFPRPGSNLARWKLILAWCLGGIGAFVVVRYIFYLVGIGPAYLTTVAAVSSVPTTAIRVWPWKTLSRLFLQTPLLLVLCTAGMAALLSEATRNWRKTLNWDGYLPEALLFAAALMALFINPNPYPYNLLHLVPYAFLFAWRYGTALWRGIEDHKNFFPLFGAAVIIAHLVPFSIATKRHFDLSNIRQEGVIALAESLTNPKIDPVFDGTGMVPTRPIIDPRSFIHGQVIGKFLNGSGPQIRDMLKANPAAVIIPSYRTDWLPKADHDFIEQRYVSVADDFWVLGKKLAPGGGVFEIVHPGRYRISTLRESDLAGTYPEGLDSLSIPEQNGRITGTLDGQSIEKEIFELEVGMHRIETDANCESAIVWIGPQVNRIHRQGGGDHRRLFFNWY